MTGQEKEIIRHLSEDDLGRLLGEADNQKEFERLVFIKRLYKGATLKEAADDVGKSEDTATNWVNRWNEGGLGKLMPSFGAVGPRSSTKINKPNSSNVCVKANRGKNT